MPGGAAGAGRRRSPGAGQRLVSRPAAPHTAKVRTIPRSRPGFWAHRPQSTHQRPCDAPGCTGQGEFRAPRSRDALTEYYWFCLEHVREYNAQWNYYAGLSEAEMERQIRADTTWERPTWPFGARSEFYLRLRNGAAFQFGAFGPGDDWHRIRTSDGKSGMRPRPGSPECLALAVLELEPPVTRDAVKARYKVLVKRHHPDANGGDRSAEERLKKINHAYSVLIKSTAW